MSILRFLYQTLYAFLQIKDRKHIEHNFHSVAGFMPQEWDLGVLGGSKTLRWGFAMALHPLHILVINYYELIWFYTVFNRKSTHVILFHTSFSFIFSSGQVKLSLNIYTMAIYLSLGKYLVIPTLFLKKRRGYCNRLRPYAYQYICLSVMLSPPKQ